MPNELSLNLGFGHQRRNRFSVAGHILPVVSIADLDPQLFMMRSAEAAKGFAIGIVNFKLLS